MAGGIGATLKSWTVKIFLGIIALSFAVWGIGDIFRGGQDPSVASVGGVKIHASQLSRAYSREVERLRVASNGAIDAEQARAMGVVQRTLQSMISRKVFDLETAGLGMTVDDATLRREIRDNPAFVDDFGDFDRTRFEYVLRQEGRSEPQYIAELRLDMARAHLIDSLIGGLEVPDALIEQIYGYRQERRVVEVVSVDGRDIADVPEPDQAAIEAYHRDNTARFTAPEYRALTYVMLRPVDLIEEIDIDETVLRTEYDLRLDEYQMPDRRDIDMFVLDDKAAADAAYDRLLRGDDFIAVGEETAGVVGADISLGPIAKAELPEDLVDPVFALSAGAVGQPIESAFGWHIVRVNKVLPAATRTFADAREELREELVVDKAIEAVFELSNLFEDELAGGATLEEASRAVGAAVETIESIDQRGLNTDGKPHESLPAIVTFLEVAFAVAPGEESALQESPGNIMFMLRADRITEPALRPLAEVRDDVIAAWKGERRGEKAQEIAKAIADDPTAATDLAAAADKHGFAPVTGGAFSRTGAGLDLNLGAGAIRAAFELTPGAVSDAVANGRGHFVVIRLKEIVAASPDREISDALEAELRQGFQGDLINGFEQAIRDARGVKVYHQLVDNLF